MRFRFIKYLGVSRKTLLEHKMRSFLTILGIIFGVAAVIAMTAIGEGAKEEALKSIQQMGIQNVFIKDLRTIRSSAYDQGKYVGSGIVQSDIQHAADILPDVDLSATVKEKEFFVQTSAFQSVSPVKGYPSLIVVIAILGGIQLISLGVIGEYLGRVFNETKHRPLYFVTDYKPSHIGKKEPPA